MTDPGQGIFEFTGTGAGLSGITYVSGNDFRAVSDSGGGARLYPLTIALDLAAGTIESASLGSPLRLATGSDHEGVAYSASRGTVFVSDEDDDPAGSFIREFSLGNGALVTTLSIPPVLLNDRPGLGFESLSLGAGALWTTTEQALAQESDTASGTEGTLIRLQRFDASSLAAAGQFAYLTEPANSAHDLLALPDGNLLVLERGPASGGTRNRIFLVDFAGATDTSALADLDAGGFTAVSKTLLFERNMGSRNFEGLALGPLRALQSYSVVLIADNGSGTQQALYPLIIHGVVPEPSATALLALAALGCVTRRRPPFRAA